MKRKIFFIAATLMTIFIIINIIFIRNGNISLLNNQISLLKVRLQESQKKKDELLKDMDEIITKLRSIPQPVLEGFEDPDRKFVDFLDYINASNLKQMNGNIIITQMPTLENQPVPLRKSQFKFNFELKKVQEIEELMDYLLDGKKYPLNFQKIEIKRIPMNYPDVSIEVALLLPTAIDLPDLPKLWSHSDDR